MRARFLAILFLALPLAAAEGHEEPARFLGISMGVWQAANLVLFLGLLVYFLRKPASGFFGGRSREVNEALQRSEENRRKAEALSREADEKIARLATDLEAFQKHAAEMAESERKELHRQGEEEVARLLKRTEAEVENRVRNARAELTAYAADLAVETARDILKRTITADDQKRLVDEGVASLGTGPARPRG